MRRKAKPVGAALLALGLILAPGAGAASVAGDGHPLAPGAAFPGTEATIPAPPVPVGAASRKAHGATGTFDLALSLTPASPTIEPRAGPAQTVVIAFDKAVTGATAAVVEGSATVGATTFGGSEVVVDLAGVANAQYVEIALTDVAAADGGTGGSGAVRIGFLAGDVNQSGAVTLADVLAVNAVLSQPVAAGNYLRDVNLSGTLSLADKLAANAKLALALPPPVPVAPTCTISPPQSVAPNTAVALALTDCAAPGGGALSYSWNLGAAAGPQVGTAASYTTPPLTATTTYFATVSANGLSTTYSTTVTVTATNSCSGYSTSVLGDLHFDGTQIDSFGMSGSKVAWGRIIIPNPLPAGWAGKTATLSVFENDGAFWKKAYLSKTACDFTPVTSAWGQGTGINLYLTFAGTGFGSVTVQPGEVWYVNVKNESLFGTPSCSAGQTCNFAVRLYPPN